MNLRDPFRFRTGLRRTQAAAVSRLGSVRPTARVFQNIALESQRSRLPQMAAALSYRTVFGLLPMVVVALVALRLFVSDVQIDQFVGRALHFAGLESIVVNVPPANDESAFWEEAPPPATPGAPGAPGATPAAPPADGAAPQERSELAETIRLLIVRAKSIDYRAIGAIGALTLVYAAISMLTEIERAFNQIFRVPIGKPWRRRMTEYWALLTLGTPCLVATFYVGEKAKGIVARTVESAGLSASGTLGLMLSGYAITVLISAVLLLMAYLLLPNTRVRIVPALAGALLAAILWEAGKWGFTQYLHYSTNYSKLYGSIALIPLFLLWIYGTWAIVLLGLHVTYYIQVTREGKAAAPQAAAWSDPPAGVVDPSAAVAIVHAVARGFVRGKPASINSIIEQTRVAGSVVSDLVTRLVEANLLHRVGVGDDPNYVSLALPPDQIAIRGALAVGYELAGANGTSTAPGAVRARLRDAHLKAAGDASIADLLGVAPAPPEGEAPVGNKTQSETSGPGDANSYPSPRRPDTLPVVPEGGQVGD